MRADMLHVESVSACQRVDVPGETPVPAFSLRRGNGWQDGECGGVGEGRGRVEGGESGLVAVRVCKPPPSRSKTGLAEPVRRPAVVEGGRFVSWGSGGGQGCE